MYLFMGHINETLPHTHGFLLPCMDNSQTLTSTHHSIINSPLHNRIFLVPSKQSIHSLSLYITDHEHCNITCVFLACNSAILHAKLHKKKIVKHACQKRHTKIHKKIQALFWKLSVKFYMYNVDCM